jgi:acyl-CoA synthetase (AMP-forming)/AMP-acid ligase II
MIMNYLSVQHLLLEVAQANAARDFLLLPQTKTRVSFGKFASLAERVATALLIRGLPRGGRVATLFLNGFPLAASLLGIMSAGGVAVPLNPALGQAEIDALADQVDATFLLTEPRHLADHPVLAASAEPLEVDGLDLLLIRRRVTASDAASADPGRPLSHRDLAVIFFTSGTTGRPRGVMLTHGNILHNAAFINQAHQLTPRDVALCVLPMYHVNGFVVTLLSPLMGRLPVILPEKFSATHFWEWVRDYRATWFSAVPTIFSILLAKTGAGTHDASSLRFARSASAPLPPAVLAEFERRTGVPVIESYGASEAGGQITSNPLPPLMHKPGSAGPAVGNHLEIVDPHNRPLPPGQVGQVRLAGPNISPGYYQDPQATAAAFRDGWFYTGDLGRLDDEGYVFLTGRLKDVINRGGEKIAPREIEDVIYLLPQVQDAVVAGVPDATLGEEIAVFLVARDHCSLTIQQVVEHCAGRLPAFKVPRHVHFVPEVPRAAAGKIQRRRLREMYPQAWDAKGVTL